MKNFNCWVNQEAQLLHSVQFLLCFEGRCFMMEADYLDSH